MLLSDFDFELPSELIAQEPIPAREQARLLRFDRRSGMPTTYHRVEYLPALLKPDDLLVINNTSVFPARLFGHRTVSLTTDAKMNVDTVINAWPRAATTAHQAFG